jgi:hypothetical protein
MNQRFTYRNPKILAHANGQACQNCGAQDGTVVAAHSNLPEHGRGSHHKSHDFFAAFLCFRCHTYLDSAGKLKDPTGRFDATWQDKREMFLSAMFKTQIILLRDGVIR